MYRKPKIGEYLSFQGRRGRVICISTHDGKLFAGLRFYGDTKITHVLAETCDVASTLRRVYIPPEEKG